MFRITAHTTDAHDEHVTVRTARPDDALALSRLATLDSGRVPQGPSLVAEADARILAALPLGSGRVIADPFEPTAELVALLELRRSQLRRSEREPRRRAGLRARVRGLARAGARI
jgi:hypothetical protein